MSESARPSPSPSPAPARLPARARTRGLVEQAFAALVRVAARAQTLEPDAAETADFERSAPLEAYAARVFDDARCVADWRAAARDALLRAPRATGDDADVPGAARKETTPLFPRLASLYASRLRETAEPSADDPEAVREAVDARRVCWFVLALIARSASLDAARRFRSSARRHDGETRSGGSGPEANDATVSETSSASSPFAAAPSGPATPAPGDARAEALAEMARVVSAETLALASRTASSPRFDARLRRGMNLGLARLCASLAEVVGPPSLSDGASDETPRASRDATSSDSSDGDEGSGTGQRDGFKKTTRRWWRGGDGAGRDETAPLAPLARRVASSHVRRLTASPAAWASLYEFCVAACAAPRFVATSTGALSAQSTGWSPEDLAFERAREEASALLDAAAAERGGAGAFRDDADPERTDGDRYGDRFPSPSDALVSAVASAAFAGLRAAEDDRRDAAAGAIAAILARHARDASLQSRSARAAVAAAYAPLLRTLVARRDEIFDEPKLGTGNASIPARTRRNVLASFLSLARDADQNALWHWLVSDRPDGIDPDAGEAFERAETPTTTFTIASTFASTNPFGRARDATRVAREPARRATRPPRLVSFLRLLCDALEAFAFRAEAKDEYVNASSSGDASADDSSRLFDRSCSSSLVAEGHRSTAVTSWSWSSCGAAVSWSPRH